MLSISTGYEGFSNPETYTLYEYLKGNPNLQEVIQNSIQDLFYNCADDTDTVERPHLVNQRIQDIVSRALTKADVVTFLDFGCSKRTPVNYNMSPLEQSFFQLSWFKINWDDISSRMIENLFH